MIFRLELFSAATAIPAAIPIAPVIAATQNIIALMSHLTFRSTTVLPLRPLPPTVFGTKAAWVELNSSNPRKPCFPLAAHGEDENGIDFGNVTVQSHIAV